MPPRVVTMTPPAATPRRGARGVPCRLIRVACQSADGTRPPEYCHHCPNKRPPFDWTGHDYKAVSELRVDYARGGRDIIHGGRLAMRTIPTMPGGRGYMAPTWASST